MSQSKSNPPKIADTFLKWYCDPDLLEDLQGDLYERFDLRSKKSSLLKAKFLFWWDVLVFIRPYTLSRKFHLVRTAILWRNYLKITIRRYRKDPIHSGIALAGLCIGLTVFILVNVYSRNELNYDQYLPEYDQIYRITTSVESETSTDHAAVSYSDLSTELPVKFPEVEAAVSLIKVKAQISNSRRSFLENEFFRATPDYFNVFQYPFIYGDPSQTFRPGSAILTRTTASKYFDIDNPLNEELQVNGKLYKITGIVDDHPRQTDLKWKGLFIDQRLDEFIWTLNYIKLKKNTDAIFFQSKLDQHFEDVVLPDFEIFNASGGYHLEPLSDIHFSQQKLYDNPKTSKYKILVFETISYLILIMSVVNFLNISLSNTGRRLKEIGIRKSFGAGIDQLKSQFLFEAFVTIILSMLSALILSSLIISFIYPVTDNIPEWSNMINSELWIKLLITTIVLSTISGSYIGFYITRLNPTKTFKGNNNSLIKKGLLTIQYIITIGLILGAVFIHRQMKLIRENTLGYKGNEIILIDLKADSNLNGRYLKAKEEFKTFSFVQNASLSGYNSWPSSDPDIDIYEYYKEGDWHLSLFNNIYVDEEFENMFEVRTSTGMFFTNEEVINAEPVVIINQALADKLNWNNPIDQILAYQNGPQFKVIGVVENFHYRTMHKTVDPLILFPNNQFLVKLMVELNSDNLLNAINSLEEKWNSIVTDHPFEFEFLSSQIQQQYKNERQLEKIFSGFSIMSILMACMGLFGFVSLNTLYMQKEYGIRKILGAGPFTLWLQHFRKYLILILISFGVALPLTVFGIHQWLSDFAYKVPVSWDAFIITFAIILFSTVIAISYHVIKLVQIKPSIILKQD